ncbi:MAG: alpha-amylase [Rhizobacter sp.]|nr:alpha-amylase [Chlorobiales bacterium]
MGLFHEVLHFVIGAYRQELNPRVFQKCEAWLGENFTPAEIAAFLENATDVFPSTPVYRGETGIKEYLSSQTDGTPNAHIVLEELILIWLENQNPAFRPITELISDAELKRSPIYSGVMRSIEAFFKTQPVYGPDGESLFDMLRAPALESPESIGEQLAFILTRWRDLLARSPLLAPLVEELMSKVLTGTDFLKEEGRYFETLKAVQQNAMKQLADADRAKLAEVRPWNFAGGDPAEKEVQLVDFKGLIYDEPEQFSADRNWMPRVILMAKSTFVWLDQLSKQYGQWIQRLDEIPDSELDTLAARGFTGLWLIGLWQRSHASERIKKINGNPEAVASAYSLTGYSIATELGGEEAYKNLRDRCKQRGIRLASDMVPNHFGIDSDWVIDHPERFVGAPEPPYPNYTFNGPDLSDNDRIGIFIEDGYWRKTDAAVVFKRVDRQTGHATYIYHGNDGTGLPWNDTAQLDYLKSEVREAVMQTILEVAHKFQIIRFDAAMTLAKKHFQRLWYPQPGTGGDIASRTAYAMSREEFDSVFPLEFWREVVDRVAVEVPDTLLLAEAFWMMEAYFVRTLGMHRVYNSAFMHMMKKEDNAGYRTYLKDILAFNPQILKRYVNFMNNPDEETAVNQFGRDGKYFGVCIVLITMPGLPMFGHGQIEGFAEKYGMEYKRAYIGESPDAHLIHRHEREIFPLLKKRAIFSDVENFLLYDFTLESGETDENVFAYSNRAGDERSLVVYHNRYGETRGRLRNSVWFMDDYGNMTDRVLGQGLFIGSTNDRYVIFRDSISGLEYIHAAQQLWETGLSLSLGAYQYHVFLNIREVDSSADRPYQKLATMLNGRGVTSIDESLLEITYEPVYYPYREAVNQGSLRYLLNHKTGDNSQSAASETAEAEAAFAKKSQSIAEAVRTLAGGTTSIEKFVRARSKEFSALLSIQKDKSLSGLMQFALPPGTDESLYGWRVMLIYLFSHRLGDLTTDTASRNCFREWNLRRVVHRTLLDSGIGQEAAQRDALLLEILITVDQMSGLINEPLGDKLARLLDWEQARTYIGANWHEGVLWFSKEKLEELIAFVLVAATLKDASDTAEAYPPDKIDTLMKAVSASEFQLEKLKTLLAPPESNEAESGDASDGILRDVSKTTPAVKLSSPRPLVKAVFDTPAKATPRETPGKSASAKKNLPSAETDVEVKAPAKRAGGGSAAGTKAVKMNGVASAKKTVQPAAVSKTSTPSKRTSASKSATPSKSAIPAKSATPPKPSPPKSATALKAAAAPKPLPKVVSGKTASGKSAVKPKATAKPKASSKPKAAAKPTPAPKRRK